MDDSPEHQGVEPIGLHGPEERTVMLGPDSSEGDPVTLLEDGGSPATAVSDARATYVTGGVCRGIGVR